MVLLVESLILVCPSKSDPWSYPRSWDGTGDGRGRGRCATRCLRTPVRGVLCPWHHSVGLGDRAGSWEVWRAARPSCEVHVRYTATKRLGAKAVLITC